MWRMIYTMVLYETASVENDSIQNVFELYV